MAVKTEPRQKVAEIIINESTFICHN